jgi:hypothetical protein
VTELLDRLATKMLMGDGCWEWTGGIDAHGYGGVWLDGAVRKAHRVMYELLVSPIPAGLELDHLCRNPGCVRPAHLEPVTHAENMRRARGLRPPKPECPHGHAYTEENTYIDSAGYRRCRTCIQAADRARRRCT